MYHLNRSAQAVSGFTVPVTHVNKECRFSMTDCPTLFDCMTDIRTIQEHDHVARGVINMKPLCRRLGIGIVVTRALLLNLTAASGELLPLRSSLDQARHLRTLTVQVRMKVLAKNWTSQLRQGDLMVPTLPQIELSSMHAL